MADEAATSHIPGILAFMYIVIAAYSALASWVTGCSLWTIPRYYAAGMLAFYAWHWLAHSPWTGEMHRLHMRHHLKAYPPKMFYGRTPETIEEDLGHPCPSFLYLLNPFRTIVGNPKHEGPLYVFMAAILIHGYCAAGSSLATLGFVAAGYVVMGLVGNALHMSFHVRGFELERYEWYLELRALHYIHHLGDMRSNLGMLNLGIDSIFGSLALTDPTSIKTRGASTVDIGAQKPSSLPEGLTPMLLRQASGSSGFLAWAFFQGGTFDHLRVNLKLSKIGQKASARGAATVALRVALVALLLAVWFETEAGLAPPTAIGVAAPARSLFTGAAIGPVGAGLDTADGADRGHALFAPVHELLRAQPRLLFTAVAISRAYAELGVAVAVLVSLLGSTMRPFLSVAAVFVLRIVVRCGGIVPLVNDAHTLSPQASPVVPYYLFVRPGSRNLFFDGGVALSVVLAIELYRLAPSTRGGAPLLTFRTPKVAWGMFGALFAAFNVALTLSTRSHWTFDVVVALLLSRYATLVSLVLSPSVDAFMP